jgi:hypothetical protein
MQLALNGAAVLPHKLNFSADMYQQQQVAAWAELLQQQRTLCVARKEH